MNPPAVISMPLSSIENMRMELEWRFMDLLEQYWEIREILEDFRYKLRFDEFAEPIPFDPLRTIGKY